MCGKKANSESKADSDETNESRRFSGVQWLRELKQTDIKIISNKLEYWSKQDESYNRNNATVTSETPYDL
jgi:hypothetical protein